MALISLRNKNKIFISKRNGIYEVIKEKQYSTVANNAKTLIKIFSLEAKTKR